MYHRRLVFALVVVALTVGACRTNKLKEYIEDIDTVFVSTTPPGAPEVFIGQSTQKSDLATAVSNIAATGLNITLQTRLSQVVLEDTVQRPFVDTFLQDLATLFAFQRTKDPDAPCDAWIDIEITRYGIEAASVESAVNYMLDANATMRTCDEERLIWETFVMYREPITTHQLYGTDDITKGMGTTVNLMVLNGLTDDQLRAMFNALGQRAGAAIVEQMRADAGRHARSRVDADGEAPAGDPPPSVGSESTDDFEEDDARNW